MEPRESGLPPPAAFPPPAPLLASPAGAGGIQALLSSLASSACGQSAAESRATPSSSSFVVGNIVKQRFCSSEEGSGSLLFLSLFAALVGLFAYLSLLAVDRARR